VNPRLAAAPRLGLWRAPTDNDRIGGQAAMWTARGVDDLERRVESVEHEAGATIVRSRYLTGAGDEIPHRMRVAALDGGGVRVDEEAVIPDTLTDLARVGTTFEVVPGHEAVEWFGPGPHETYPDRQRSGVVGRWRSTVTEQAFPYIRPQETGLHVDVRWLELRDASEAGLRLVAPEPLAMSATHHRDEDLATATHDVEVVSREAIVVHIDAAHRGLGTASCGPDTMPRYLVGPGTYRWTWELQPVEPSGMRA
jgi:beta-galactosidase